MSIDPKLWPDTVYAPDEDGVCTNCKQPRIYHGASEVEMTKLRRPRILSDRLCRPQGSKSPTVNPLELSMRDAIDWQAGSPKKPREQARIDPTNPGKAIVRAKGLVVQERKAAGPSATEGSEGIEGTILPDE